MTFTEIIQLIGILLFTLFIAYGAFSLIDGIVTFFERRRGDK